MELKRSETVQTYSDQQRTQMIEIKVPKEFVERFSSYDTVQFELLNCKIDVFIATAFFRVNGRIYGCMWNTTMDRPTLPLYVLNVKKFYPEGSFLIASSKGTWDISTEFRANTTNKKGILLL